MRVNPLLGKELRLRMRNWRTFLLLTLYLLVLGGFGVINFTAMTAMLRYGGGDLATVGRSLFIFLAIMQTVLIYFLVPGITAGAVSSERERVTFDLLVCTQLSPFAIVWGKLASSLSFVFMLIIASLPLYGVAFLLGGVAPSELATLVMIFIIIAVIYGSFAIFFSSRFKRSISAIISTYALGLFMSLGTLIIAGMLGAIFYGSTSGSLLTLLVFNPAAFFEWLFPEIKEVLQEISNNNYPFATQWLKFWHLALLVQGGMAALGLFLATRAVNPLQAGRRSG